jgi:hypothetical protein
MKKKLVYLLGCLLLIGQAGRAQYFRYQAPLDTIRQEGFYKISLSPQITGYLEPGMPDIRLFDSALREVPYILQREEPVQYKQLFNEYEIISKVSTPAAGTSLVLRNAARSKINNISLIIQNTNAAKKAQLSGSNNAREWYTINDRFVIQPANSQLATSEVKALDFPLSDYEYYKLDMNDSVSAPINIIKAGYYDTYAESGKYVPIEGVQIKQRDSVSLKQTFVHVHIPYPTVIDKLVVEVASPAYYLRQVEVKVAKVTRDKRKRERVTYQTVASGTLHSAGNTAVFPNQLQAQDFYLLIHNADNVPLQISAVKAYQLNTYMVASLQKGETYQLRFGQADLTAPVYDLAYFKEELPAGIHVIQPGTVTTIAGQQAVPNTSTAWFSNKLLIWGAIGLVILLLGYMSFQMIKEMKPRS